MHFSEFCWLAPPPFSVSPKRQQQKWSFQMIHANKAGEEQITKGSPRRTSRTQRARFTVCVYVSVCKAKHGSKRMIQLCARRQNEDLWRAVSARRCYLHCHSCLLKTHCFTGLTRAGNINSSPFFSEPRLFQVLIVLFFFAEASNWKDCNCKMSPRLSDCNFNSLTSSRWEYLEQYIIASDGSWEYLNGLRKKKTKKTLYESVRSDSVPLGIFWPSATL